MDLDESDAVELLAGGCPVGHRGEVHDAGPAGHAHQGELLVHGIGRRHAQSHFAGQCLGIDGIGDEDVLEADGRVGAGDLGVGVEHGQGAVPGRGEAPVEFGGRPAITQSPH
jgi:hypothetical protein